MNSHLLDLSGSEPIIKDTRISVLDVYHISEKLDDEEADKTLFDEWDLSSEEVETALNYYRENEDEMQDIQQQKSELVHDYTEHLPDDDIDQYVPDANFRIERMSADSLWLCAYTHDENEADHHYDITVTDDAGLKITHREE
jgi:uncharacterized protein (DUF433 family)